MRERAPQLIQPGDQRSGLLPTWAWAILALVIVGGGIGAWLLLNPFGGPSQPSSVALAQPSATPRLTPTHIISPILPPTRIASPTLPPPTVTPTATLQYAVVSRGLNVREQPSAKAHLLGGLSRGAVVTLVGKPVKAEGYDWYHVQGSGWVVGGSLTFYPTLDAAKKAKP